MVVIRANQNLGGQVPPGPHTFRRPCDDDDLHVFPTAHHTTIANLTKNESQAKQNQISFFCLQVGHFFLFLIYQNKKVIQFHKAVLRNEIIRRLSTS